MTERKRPEGLLDRMERLEEERARKRHKKESKRDGDLDLDRIG